MKVNIGCGYKKIDGYVNCDIDPACNPDLILNLETDRFPFEDNSVDEVLASHVLEHLGDGYFHCLQELYRVCKPGALIFIVVPHPRHDDFLDDPTHKRPITKNGLELFSKKFNYECIAENFNYVSTLGLQYNIDFEIVNFNYVYEDKELFDMIQKMNFEIEVKTRYNVIAQINVTWMVIK